MLLVLIAGIACSNTVSPGGDTPIVPRYYVVHSGLYPRLFQISFVGTLTAPEAGLLIWAKSELTSVVISEVHIGRRESS